MLPLASAADFLVQVGATTAGGAIIVSTFVGVVGVFIQALVVDQKIPIQTWTAWGGLFGGFCGLIVGLYEYA